MIYSWLCILPPLMVILVTILTRSVIISLTSGIFTACLIATNLNPFSAATLGLQRLFQETHLSGLATGSNLDHVYTFSFLLLLGVLIQIMNHSGGIRAYTHFLLKFIKTPQRAQQTSLALSSTLFIDDYVNNLTVGAIMRPVTDHFKIARAKLAFLLDSMSGPLCMLIPASSWVAFILAQMQASGISNSDSSETLIQQDALFVYIACIPFLMYPILIVFSAWVITSFNLSFGAMGTQEAEAKKTGNLYGGKSPLHVANTAHEQLQGTLLDFILPISTFIVGFLAAIAYSGKSVIFGGHAHFMQTLQAADPFWSLWVASMLGVAMALMVLLSKNSLHNFSYIVKAFLNGFMLMKNSLIILLLAWTLSTLLKNDLHTGAYLAELLPHDMPVAYLPFLMFIFCLGISASTGSVWGTIALMLPLAIPLYYNLALGSPTFLNNLYPLLGALFSGAVAGSHFSPITDAMIMTSFSAGCYHLDHVRTQISYASSALIGSLTGFLIICSIPSTFSYGATVAVCLGTGIGVTATLLFIRASFGKKE